MTRLTEEIERHKKVRNDIEQETNVQISVKMMESEKQRLEIARDEEYALLEQQQEVEIRRAAQANEIAKEQAERKKLAEQAEILAKQEVEQSRIELQQRRLLSRRRSKKIELLKCRVLKN